MNTSALFEESRKLVRLLKRKKAKIVFAESCTGGMISSAMTRFPGISNYYCGSSVVYRLDTKTKWLGISAAFLKKHGAVSRKTAESMARQILKKTPEARFSASITGHLGPGAPHGQDGLCYLGFAQRKRNAIQVQVEKIFLSKKPNPKTPLRKRARRQELASLSVIQMVRSRIVSKDWQGKDRKKS